MQFLHNAMENQHWLYHLLSRTISHNLFIPKPVTPMAILNSSRPQGAQKLGATMPYPKDNKARI
jgi:hypothetical protein